MSDRELLELAAKAAGIRYDGYDEDAGCDIWFVPELARYVEWNPLTADDDALRLAVKLGMVLAIDSDGMVQAIAANGDGLEPMGDDRYAATRRAIVRAAAAMGARQ